MNLLLLVNPKEAEGHPFELFFVGAVYAFLGVLLSVVLFPEQAGLVMITITVAATTPIIYQIITYEMMQEHVHLVGEHRKAILVFALLFLGFVIGYLAGFLVLPPFLREFIFSAQTDAIAKLTGGFFSKGMVSLIITNNMRVLFFSVLLSVFFGTGGILILAWNASVLAVALGSFMLHKMAAGTPMVTAVGASFAKYMIHGLPEMVAYFIGGLAGGMVFYAIVQKQHAKRVLFEAVLLLLLAAAILVVASFVEVSVQPAIV